MSEPTLLDKTYHCIMKSFIQTGQAPFYTEIAKELGISVEDGKKALGDLFRIWRSAWLFPNTDYIASFPPFSNLPTQYRITIEGEHKWFAQ